MTKFITHKQAIFLNGLMIKKYSPNEIIGIKDENMLDSAIMRPRQMIGGEEAYPNLPLKAAALFESLAQNHPFQNANKRTAFACMHQFLYLNGYSLKVEPKIAEDFTVHVVVEKPNLDFIAAWISQHIVPKKDSPS